MKGVFCATFALNGTLNVTINYIKTDTSLCYGDDGFKLYMAENKVRFYSAIVH